MSAPVGRFAPSPTGPLHLGSLATALASYCIARQAGGQWQLRIEDIDPPRNPEGASRAILHSLAQHGFGADGPVRWQHHNSARYEAALGTLRRRGLLYACRCSRKDLSQRAPIGPLGRIYPGSCRARQWPETDAALRLRVDDRPIHFVDGLCGRQQQTLSDELGDFVLKRRDGLYAYQLAVVCDDHADGITQVVRGRDILDNTARQIYLQRQLDLPTPSYIHLPLLLHSNGQKLSKQNHAPAIDDGRPLDNLLHLWRLLAQAPLGDCHGLNAFWSRAIATWDSARLPKQVLLASHAN